MRTRVERWGDTASVRIPAAILRAVHLEIDAAVEIHEQDGRIIIQPLRPPTYPLEALLAGITPDNLHDEIDVGSLSGRETL